MLSETKSLLSGAKRPLGVPASSGMGSRCRRYLGSFIRGVLIVGLVLGLVGCSSTDNASPWRHNWPQANPTAPPTLMHFANLTPRQLIPYVLGKKVIDPEDDAVAGRDGYRAACAWFIWKTKDLVECNQLRRELANAIVTCLHEVEQDKNRTLHDYSYLASFLGPLGTHQQTLQLFKEVRYFDCCYAPSLIRSLAMLGKSQDVPVLIEAIDKEREGCYGVINKALQKITGVSMSLKNDPIMDKKAWQKWWEENKDK